MKTSTVLRLALLGAFATAARAWDFTDELDGPVTKTSGASKLGDGESDNDEQRIYGGQEADAALYKYIVSLRKSPEGMTYCGGSLIAPMYVLTAAHCVKTNNVTMYASIGSKYASGTKDGERIAVAEAYVHPKYEKASHVYDVAILKLSAKSDVTPVPLAAADGSDNKEKTMAVVRGWGLTETKVQASTLQEVNVRIATNAECNKQYNNRITDGMLCAGEGGGKDSCQGDSGGPLVSNNKLIGVVSWGGECGVAPGVYQRVTNILDFINEKIGGGSATNSTKAPSTPAPAATTAAPTTAPVTVAPTTAPVTVAPTTAPVTEAPTSAPVTVAPTTAPVTEAPASTPPATTTAPVTTTAPTTAPTTPAPATTAPTTSAPASTAPVTEAPVTKAPSTKAPSSDEPSSDAGATTYAPVKTVAPTTAPATTAPVTSTPSTKIPGKVTCMVKPKNGGAKSKDATSTKNDDIKQSYGAARSVDDEEHDDE